MAVNEGETPRSQKPRKSSMIITNPVSRTLAYIQGVENALDLETLSSK